MAVSQSLAAFKKSIQRALVAAGPTSIGASGGTLGFFGKTPVARPAAPTAASVATIGATYTATEQAVAVNTRTRVNEIEAALKAYGLLP